MTVVLDTCGLIWWSLDPAKLSKASKQACDHMERDKDGLVPSISIWEIALKVKNKKLDLGVHLDDYVSAVKESSTVRIVPIDEDIWLASVKLDWAHQDPVDRVVVAMAKRYQSSIITADKEIRKFYSDVAW